jgi:hypothetical protein
LQSLNYNLFFRTTFMSFFVPANKDAEAASVEGNKTEQRRPHGARAIPDKIRQKQEGRA